MVHLKHVFLFGLNLSMEMPTPQDLKDSATLKRERFYHLALIEICDHL